MDPQSWPAHRQDMAPPPMPLIPQSAVDTTPFLSTQPEISEGQKNRLKALYEGF
jgi:hypothetical protein